MPRSSIYRPGTQSTTPEQRAEIRRRRWVEHQTIKTIADHYGLGESTISAICNADEDGLYEHRVGNGRRTGPRFGGVRTAFYPRTPNEEPTQEVDPVLGLSTAYAANAHRAQNILQSIQEWGEPALRSAKAIKDDHLGLESGRALKTPPTPLGDLLKAKIEFHRETLAGLELIEAMSPEARSEIMKVLK